jgi:hypothetical protein
MIFSSLYGVITAGIIAYLGSLVMNPRTRKKKYFPSSSKYELPLQPVQDYNNSILRRVPEVIHITENDPELTRTMELHRWNIDQYWKNLLSDDGNKMILKNQTRLNKYNNQWGTGPEIRLGRTIVGRQQNTQEEKYNKRLIVPTIRWHRHCEPKGIEGDHPIYKLTHILSPGYHINGVFIKRIPHLYTLKAIQLIDTDGSHFQYDLSNLSRYMRKVNENFYLPFQRNLSVGKCGTKNVKCKSGTITFIYRSEPKYVPLAFVELTK